MELIDREPVELLPHFVPDADVDGRRERRSELQQHERRHGHCEEQRQLHDAYDVFALEGGRDDEGQRYVEEVIAPTVPGEQ